MFRNALELEALTKGYDQGPLFKNVNMLVEVGDKVAVIGANGIGKTTFLKTLVGSLLPDSGTVKWSENSQIGYYAQDHAEDFDCDLTVFDWMSQWKKPVMMSKRFVVFLAVYYLAKMILRKSACPFWWRTRPDVIW